MVVEVDDNRGTYTRRTSANVIVNVVRNSSPFFVNTPYSFQVSENELGSTSLYGVTARDTDLFGSIIYRVIGDGYAPVLFGVDARGIVSATGSLGLDFATSYTVSLADDRFLLMCESEII